MKIFIILILLFLIASCNSTPIKKEKPLQPPVNVKAEEPDQNTNKSSGITSQFTNISNYNETAANHIELRTAITDISKEISSEINIDCTSLEYNYHIFRNNQCKLTNEEYTISNDDFLNALTNEFDGFQLSREKSLKKAISLYEQMTNQFEEEAGFLHQRIGECYFKMKNYQQSDEYLNLAILENVENSELFYYLAMIKYYYKKDLNGSEYYIDKINPEDLYIGRQDFLVFKAILEWELGNKDIAYTTCQIAIDIDPARFYKNYDLLPVYVHDGEFQEAEQYLKKSSSILMMLKQKKYHIKACNQMIYLNRMLKKPTFSMDLKLTYGFDIYPNILYFSKNIQSIDRKKSVSLQIPLFEKRQSRSDKNENAYSPVFEDYMDYNSNSFILLTECILGVSNVVNRFPEMSFPMPKLYCSNTISLILSPTNRYIITSNSNDNILSNDIITNQSNLIYSLNSDFTYLININKFNEISGSWGYVFYGFNSTNEICITVFYPDKMYAEKVNFFLKTGDATFIIQDVNQDGKEDWILLDDDVYILNPKKL